MQADWKKKNITCLHFWYPLLYLADFKTLLGAIIAHNLLSLEENIFISMVLAQIGPALQLLVFIQASFDETKKTLENETNNITHKFTTVNTYYQILNHSITDFGNQITVNSNLYWKFALPFLSLIDLLTWPWKVRQN